jgi:hypothetical protein
MFTRRIYLGESVVPSYVLLSQTSSEREKYPSNFMDCKLMTLPFTWDLTCSYKMAISSADLGEFVTLFHAKLNIS